MKQALIAINLYLLALFGGCTVAEQSADDVGRQFQEGIQGRGQLVPNDPTSDSFGSEYQ